MKLGNEHEWIEGSSDEIINFLAKNTGHFTVSTGKNIPNRLFIVLILFLIIAIIGYSFIPETWSPLVGKSVCIIILALAGIILVLIQINWKNKMATLIAFVGLLILFLVGFGVMTPFEVMENVKNQTENYIKKQENDS